jgi:cell division protein ZipA
MNFSTQLRVILLIAGGVAMLLLYLLGKRHGRVAERTEQSTVRNTSPAVQDFGPAADVDEEELETPAYLRRASQGMRHVDETLPSVTLPDAGDDWMDDELPASASPAFDDDGDERDAPQVQLAQQVSNDDDVAHESVREELVESDHIDYVTEHVAERRAEPTLDSQSLDELVASHRHVEPVMDAPQYVAPSVVKASEAQPVMPDAPVLEQVVTMPAPATVAVTPSTPPAKSAPANKRKIVALRLSVPQRVLGEQLLSLLQRENLQHGRFDIFHRLHEDVSVFSVASMMEPGSFDLGSMREQQYPGITFFMLLPGPLDGLVAWDQMLSCAQRLAHATQGVLQDERGHKLTSMATDRLREDVLDFQHLIGSLDIVTH